QMFSHWLLIPEVVILFDEAVKQRLLWAAPHLLHFQRQPQAQRSAYGPRISHYRFGPPPVCQRISRRAAAYRGQLDLAGAIQLQQQATANHVAQRTIGLSPSPGLTQLAREKATTRSRMSRDQLPNEGDIWGGDPSAPVAPRVLHGV